MQLRRLTLFALAALAAVACGDEESDDVASPDRLRLTIVSGDRQTAPVRPPATASASAALVPAANLPPNLLPEPLVARIAVDGASPSASPLGPSFAALPSDLVVTFRVVQPQDQLGRDCGESFIDSAKPGADGLVTTYWERGTYAGECRMEVRLVVDGQPRVDTVFVATFEPGPVRFLDSPNQPPTITAEDSIWIPDFVAGGRDEYHNEIAPEDLTTHPMSVSWAWVPLLAPTPSTPTGTGWRAHVPPEAADWPGGYCTPGLPCVGPNATLYVWLGDNPRPSGISFYVLPRNDP